MARRIARAYLGGPDVFRPDAARQGERLKEICRQVGLDGRFPTDGALDVSGLTKRERATRIKRENMRLILGCDLMLANMEPWRGPGMDGGTAWEMGFAEALGLPVFGYTTDRRPYRDRVAGVRQDGTALLDPEGMTVEDFDTVDNLMMAADPMPLHGSAHEAAAAAARWWADRVEAGPEFMQVEATRELMRTRLAL